MADPDSLFDHRSHFDLPEMTTEFILAFIIQKNLCKKINIKFFL